MPKKSAEKPAPVAGKKKRKFGFADAVIIVSVACLAFVGWTVYYGTNIAPAEGKAKDVAACVAFLDGFEHSHFELAQNNVTGYIDEFFKGNDAAMVAADPRGSLNELLIQVGMQRLSVNYDMTAEQVAGYLEPLAMQVHDTPACMSMPKSTPTPTP